MVNANPYVFIVGCARSGTSLLRRMVDAHPDLAIARESHWIPTYYEERTGLTEDGLVTAALIDELAANHRFARMKLTRRDLEDLLASADDLSYPGFVSSIFDVYARRRGKSYSGDKTPGYVKQIPTLGALWPRARFVHLIRDARDVCQSLLTWRAANRGPGRFSTWGTDKLATAALWWEWQVRMGREAGASLGDRYQELHYESLVSDPVGACRTLCSFLTLPFDEAMLRPHEGRQAGDGGSDKGAWRPPTAGLRDWRTQMDHADRELVEAVAGELLEDLGYETSTAADPRLLDGAARLRKSFQADQRARRFGVPSRWEGAGRSG